MRQNRKSQHVTYALGTLLTFPPPINMRAYIIRGRTSILMYAHVRMYAYCTQGCLFINDNACALWEKGWFSACARAISWRERKHAKDRDCTRNREEKKKKFKEHRDLRMMHEMISAKNVAGVIRQSVNYLLHVERGSRV